MSERGSSTTGWRLGIAIVIIIAAFALQYFSPVPDKQWIATGNTDAARQSSQAGRWVNEYAKCGHSVTLEENIDRERLNDLLTDIPELQVRQSGQGTVLVSVIDDYCPADAQQRYLGVWEDYLAIFRGPAGSGEMERITQIRVENLPVEWQEQLLEGKLVFENELLLLEALDSLDEYQS